jgi:hypothetical protein
MKSPILTLAFSFLFLATNAQEPESLHVNWPLEYKWKSTVVTDNKQVHTVDLAPGAVSTDIAGHMTSYKGVKGANLTLMSSMIFQQLKASSPSARFTLIEENDTAKNAWSIFTIESAINKKGKKPESQLYYMLQGNSAIYIVSVGMPGTVLQPAFIDKWSKIFRGSYLANP